MSDAVQQSHPKITKTLVLFQLSELKCIGKCVVHFCTHYTDLMSVCTLKHKDSLQ